MNILGIDEQTFFDNNKIKYITGMAGASKSTDVHEAFKSRDEPYMRTTANNAQRRDAEERFNSDPDYRIIVKTAASGLCTNIDFHFYLDFKEVDTNAIVIDEFYQTDKKVIEWAIENVGKHNIIMTGDERQLLPPHKGSAMLKLGEELKNRSDVVVSELTYTKRPVNDKTRKVFDEWYELAGEKISFKPQELNFLSMPFDDLDYNVTDTFAPHTKDIEKQIYAMFDLSKRYDLPCTFKGYIAAKDVKNSVKYPILPQKDAELLKARAYLQIANVGCVTRLQGQEVLPGNKLYYLVNENSVLTSREVYTLVTRCKDIDDLRIVYVPRHSYSISTYFGKPVYKEKTAVINYEASIDDEKTREHVHDMKENWGFYPPVKITPKQMKDKIDEYYAINKFRLKKDEIYHSRYIKDLSGDIVYYVDDDDVDYDKNGKAKTNAGSLIRHEGNLQYSYVIDLYRELERHGLERFRPCMVAKRHKEEFEIDLYSAFPHILKFCDIPVDGNVTYEEDTSGERINLYIYTGDYLPPNCLMEDELKKRVDKYNLGSYFYLCSVPRGKSSYMGDWLYEKVHKDIESKESVSGSRLNYGYWGKEFLTLDGSCDKEYYVTNERYKYKLLWCYIYSIQHAYMLDIFNIIDDETKHINIDAVYFNNLESLDINKVIDILPKGFHFRVRQYHNNFESKSIVYQTYEELKHRRAKNLEKQKANMTEEEKEEARRNERERKRLYRAKQRAIANSKKN